MNRLESLVLHGEQRVSDESIIDTLNDMANYAVMTRMELEAKPDGQTDRSNGCGYAD